jgi:hypothetical protein
LKKLPHSEWWRNPASHQTVVTVICAAPMRTLLIQKGHFVGHKYRFNDGGGYAILLAGENVIEIYDDEGKLLKTVGLETNGGE